MVESAPRAGRTRGELIAAAADRAGIGLCLVDDDLCYSWVNDAFCALLGYDRGSLLGQSILETTHPDDVELDAELFARVLRSEIPYFGARKRYVRGDGTILVGDLLATVCEDNNGDPIVGIGVLVDAEQADATTQRIETLQRSAAVGQFTTSAVHELRNSLASLGLVGESLQATFGDDPSLDLLKREIGHALDLVGSITRFARPPVPSEAIPIFHPVEILIEQTEALLHLVVPAGTSLTIEIMTPGLTPKIAPQEFQQVLMNLVLNARDATVGKGGKISVTAQVKETDDSVAEITVADNGQGMAPDELAKAFDPYFSTKGASGTGLGLSICREIAERHGGSIIAESTLGVASRFVVRLPVDDSIRT